LCRYLNRGFQPVYLDESGFETEALRLHGYSHKSQLVHAQRTGKRKARTNLLLAQVGKNLLAPWLFSNSCNTAIFNTWLEQCLLQELPPKSLVIMDNASFHKSAKTKKIIENAGHILLFLPPYSPQFNPIEQTFAILKAKRRKLNCTPDELFD
jgi:hypothetical protein